MELEILYNHIEKIVSLNEYDKELLGNAFRKKIYKKNQFIFYEGDSVLYHNFILSGLTKLFLIDEAGNEHIVSFAMEDWWESDFYAFYTESNASLSLVCLEDTIVLSINKDDYINLCNNSLNIQRFFLEKANFGFIAMQNRVISTLTLNTFQRYNQFLKKYPNLKNRISKTQLAYYLGVSRETLSRLDL